MADPERLAPWAQRAWSLPAPVRLEHIAVGVDNHNWKLTDGGGACWVLTRVLVIAPPRLRWLGEVLRGLHGAGVPCPVPRPPAAEYPPAWGGDWLLAPWLPGEPASQVQVTGQLAEALGAQLARLHRAGLQLPPPPADSPPPEGELDSLVRDFAGQLGAAERDALAEVLDQRPRLQAAGLVQGTVHGDLFRDNVLVDVPSDSAGPSPAVPSLSVIDFYAARRDALAYDLAVSALDWCWDTDSRTYAPQTLLAMLRGYRGEMALPDADLAALPPLLQRAGAELLLRRMARERLRPLPPERAVDEGVARWRGLDALAAALRAEGICP